MELTKDVSLALAGELDMVNEPQIARQIADLAQPGVHVHLDLTGVTFMDSSALRGLILGQRLCRAQDGDLTITAASAVVRRLLEIAGMSDHFDLSETA